MFCIHQCFYTICCKCYGIPYVRIYPLWSFVFSCVDLMMATIAETCSLIWCLRDNIYIYLVVLTYFILIWYYLALRDAFPIFQVKTFLTKICLRILRFFINLNYETRYPVFKWRDKLEKSGNSEIKGDGFSINQIVLVRMGFSSTSCAHTPNLCSTTCQNR
jgi:hypothetical protein